MKALSNDVALVRALSKKKSKKKAKILSRFFKTGKGEYGEGDVFWGITVPLQRSVARLYSTTSLDDLQKVLKSPIHEQRLTALLILVDQYKKADDSQKKVIFLFYKKNIRHINNWDLVDLTAPSIIGEYMQTFPDKGRALLNNLSGSKNIWSRRIAIVSTLACIRKQRYQQTLFLAKRLTGDSHDLIHKATGWMLREVGKRDKAVLKKFLDQYASTMPRTMLRYAIERFEKKEREQYLTA